MFTEKKIVSENELPYVMGEFLDDESVMEQIIWPDSVVT